MKSRSVLGCLCCLMAVMALAVFATASHARENQLNSQNLYASNLNIDASPTGLSEDSVTTATTATTATATPNDVCMCLISSVCTCSKSSECTCACSRNATAYRQMLLCATHKVRHSVHVHRGARNVRYGHSFQRSRCRGGICT